MERPQSIGMRIMLIGILAVTFGSGCCELTDSCRKCDPSDPACGVEEQNDQPLYGLGLDTLSAVARLGIQHAVAPFSGSNLPASADLSSEFPPPGAQGMQNSCVGWSVAYGMKSFHERREENRPFVVNGSIDPSRVFSPAFVYNQINKGQDRGAYFNDALNLVQGSGAAPWAAMPYDERSPFGQPSQQARQSASPYRIASWRQIAPSDLTEIKAQVANGFPVLIGAKVDAGFQRLPGSQVWRTLGSVLGLHAMVVVGYDDARQAFKVMNSWGQPWADRGFGWIAYSLFPTAVVEAYVTRDAPNGGTGPSPGPITPTDPAESSVFSITRVTHNVPLFLPGFGNLNSMRFEGQVSIPAGAGTNFQIVILIYLMSGSGGKGPPLPGRTPLYAMPSGQAATGTPAQPLSSNGISVSWFAHLPYGALPPGQWNLVAEPVLFVNGFGVKRSALIPFFAVAIRPEHSLPELKK